MVCSLRLADVRLGLLINFGQTTIKAGITRIVNGLEESYSSSPLALFASWRLCASYFGSGLARLGGGPSIGPNPPDLRPISTIEPVLE